MALETSYTARIMSAPQSYLTQANPTISTVEQGTFCSFISNATLSTDQCSQLTQQIKKQGLSTYFFTILQTIKQMQLNFQASLSGKALNNTLYVTQMNGTLAGNVETLTLAILPAQ